LEVGDLAVIHDVGAHGHSMGYQYGGRLRCGEYLRSADGTVTMIRRPETAEDYLQTAIF
jgi:diaminopimelate decarboxylase